MVIRMQVPTLETPHGGIWESNAIARYVARLSDKGLFGSTLFEAVGRLSVLPVPCMSTPMADQPMPCTRKGTSAQGMDCCGCCRQK